MQPERKDLCGYRLQKAQEDLQAARVLFDKNFLSQALNRSYYAIFHSVRALFALDAFETRKHSGLIAYFNKNYIASGGVEKEFSKILMKAERVRNKSDYDDFYIVSREATQEQIMSAEKFIKRMEGLIKQKLAGHGSVERCESTG